MKGSLWLLWKGTILDSSRAMLATCVPQLLVFPVLTTGLPIILSPLRQTETPSTMRQSGFTRNLKHEKRSWRLPQEKCLSEQTPFCHRTPPRTRPPITRNPRRARRIGNETRSRAEPAEAPRFRAASFSALSPGWSEGIRATDPSVSRCPREPRPECPARCSRAAPSRSRCGNREVPRGCR